MSERTPDQSNFDRWWKRHAELVPETGMSPGGLDEFYRLPDWFIHTAEGVGLDSSVLYHLYKDTNAYEIGNTDTPPAAGDDVFVFLERLRIRLAQPSAPQSSPPAEPQAPAAEAVILNRLGERPIVHGEEQLPLTEVEFNVLMALKNAGAAWLSLKQLEAESGSGDVRGVLKRLRKRPAWAKVIELAGRPGVGYRLVQ